MNTLKKVTVSIISAYFITTGSVNAASVAVSLAEITNFTVSGVGSSNYTISGWTFSNDFAISSPFYATNAHVNDPDGACNGCSYDNSFMAHGNIGSDYIYADALIGSTDLKNSGSASAITEIYSAGTGYSTASARNIFSGTINIPDAGATPTSPTHVNIGFDIDLLLRTMVDSGDFAQSSFGLNVSLTNTSNSNIFYSWADSGLQRSISGNNEYLLDSIAFNSGDLELGQNTEWALDITMNNDVTTNVTTVVPVPAAVWLFGSGLIGLVGVARRR